MTKAKHKKIKLALYYNRYVPFKIYWGFILQTYIAYLNVYFLDKREMPELHYAGMSETMNTSLALKLQPSGNKCLISSACQTPQPQKWIPLRKIISQWRSILVHAPTLNYWLYWVFVHVLCSSYLHFLCGSFGKERNTNGKRMKISMFKYSRFPLETFI